MSRTMNYHQMILRFYVQQKEVPFHSIVVYKYSYELRTLTISFTVTYNSVSNNIRTIMMQRSLNGISGDHFSFPTAPGDLNMISAIGNSVQLSYHKSRTGGKITLIPTKKDACICQPKSKTYISYMDSSTQEFHYDCLDHPR